MRIQKMFDEDELKSLPYIVDRSMGDNTDVIRPWLRDNCEGQWSVEIWHICFELESDMILFRLRFV